LKKQQNKSTSVEQIQAENDSIQLNVFARPVPAITPITKNPVISREYRFLKENRPQYLRNDNHPRPNRRVSTLKTYAISQNRAANLRVLSITVDLLSCACAVFIAQGAKITRCFHPCVTAPARVY